MCVEVLGLVDVRAGLSFAERWANAGLDNLHFLPAESNTPLKWSLAESGEAGGGGGPLLSFKVESLALNKSQHRVAKLITHYLITPTGEIGIDVELAVEKWVPPLGRVGLRLKLRANEDDELSWLGRGPGENYPDRHQGVFVGVHRSRPFLDGHVPYIRPQENGSHGGCHWAQVGSFMVRGGTPFSFRCSPYSDEALAAATHQTDLVTDAPDGGAARALELHVDTLMMGLGGDDSWSPSVHPPYLLNSHRSRGKPAYKYQVWLTPMGPEDHARDIARRPVYRPV
uniref:beta-galactosidase n=1 Tax=Octactis speculum TaxID=3111310 RepID=A0A7S2B415_9STRA